MLKKVTVFGLLLAGILLSGCSTAGNTDITEQEKEDDRKKEEEKKDEGEYCSQIKAAVLFCSPENVEKGLYSKTEKIGENYFIELTDTLSRTVIYSDLKASKSPATFVVYYSDYDGYENPEGKKKVPSYEYKLTSGKGFNLGGNSGDSKIIYSKGVTLAELNDLPCVKVTSDEKVLYEKNFSDFKFVEFSSLKDGVARIRPSTGDFTTLDKYNKKKSLFDISSTKYASYFTLSYGEYCSYLESAYNKLKGEKLSEIKREALFWTIYANEDSSLDIYIGEAPDDDENSVNQDLIDRYKDAVFAEVDSVYASFDSFKARYFEGYDSSSLMSARFCIPKAVVRDLSVSSYFGYLCNQNKEKTVFYDGSSKIKGIFSDYGVFFNTAPGVDALSLEVDAFRTSDAKKDKLYSEFCRKEGAYRHINKYYWNLHSFWSSSFTKENNVNYDNKEYYDSTVSEVCGGLVFNSSTGNIDMTLSSLKYVEMVKEDGNLLGKLRNSFFCYVDDGTPLKSINIVGNVIETADIDVDYVDNSKPFFDRYNLLVKNGDKYELVGNGQYVSAASPYFMIVGTYKGL